MDDKEFCVGIERKWNVDQEAIQLEAVRSLTKKIISSFSPSLFATLVQGTQHPNVIVSERCFSSVNFLLEINF